LSAESQVDSALFLWREIDAGFSQAKSESATLFAAKGSLLAENSPLLAAYPFYLQHIQLYLQQTPSSLPPTQKLSRESL
jgi:hypothetical protein